MNIRKKCFASALHQILVTLIRFSPFLNSYFHLLLPPPPPPAAVLLPSLFSSISWFCSSFILSLRGVHLKQDFKILVLEKHRNGDSACGKENWHSRLRTLTPDTAPTLLSFHSTPLKRKKKSNFYFLQRPLRLFE